MIELDDMRYRVAIQAPVSTQDSFGQVNAPGTYTTVVTRWAAIEPLSGKQLEIARQLASEITHRFTFRYRVIPLSSRLLYDGRKFQILYVRNVDETKELVEVLAVERK